MPQSKVINREHGTTSMYKAGCKCAPCREANKEWSRRYRARYGYVRARSLKGEKSIKAHDDAIDALLEILHG